VATKVETTSGILIGLPASNMSDCLTSRRAPIEIQPHKHARNNIRQIIMAARCVINRVPAGSSRPPLQPNQLSRQARIIEQFNPLGVQ
jgi:hypothetical protein